MKNRIRNKTPLSRRDAVRLFRFVLLLLLIPAATQAQQEFAKPADLPDWHVVLWDQVIRTDHWYFGWYSAPLGDINGDGYDDFAVSSRGDTTFIFLGGDSFDQQEAFIVRGGSSGIASADFNRDGKMDLVTAIDNWPPGEWPQDYRGAIRIFLQKDSPERFAWEPDLLIEGDTNELVGKSFGIRRSSVQRLDYNGDGWPDIVTKATDTRDSVKWKAVLYFGGPDMDVRYDAEFRVGNPQSANHPYVNDILVGDLNGDGYDDVVIWGRIIMDSQIPGIDYWDVFLGNAQGHAGTPDRVLRADRGWSPEYGVAAIMDVDGDGYDDILDVAQHKALGDALLFHGKAVLPEIILPDDSIPNLNPDPLLDLSPQILSPVGDMNGDGTPDLVMAWNKALAPGGSAYYFYPGGSQFKTPLGYFGTIPQKDHVDLGVYPVGDVNGDGYDDIITLGKGYTSATTNRFQIWLGARELQTAIEQSPSPGSLDLELSPNPVPIGTHALRVAARGLRPGACDLEVTDLLGRMRLRESRETANSDTTFTLNLRALEAGVYVISLRQGAERKEQKLIVN